MPNLQPPIENADKDFLQDVVNYGAIDYSFTDYQEGVKVDFQYLCTRLDTDTMTALTDKIKDLISDALDELDEEETED